MSHRHALEIGDELPSLEIDLTPDFVAHYARVIDMPAGRFLDDAGAQGEGLPGQIAPGNLSLALISRALLRWRPGVSIVRLGTTFRGLVRTSQTVHVRGSVTELHEHAGGTTVECDVWIEGAEGDRLVVGTATLALPR